MVTKTETLLSVTFIMLYQKMTIQNHFQNWEKFLATTHDFLRILNDRELLNEKWC